MKPLSSTWIISVFITICSLEIVQFVANLAMITALKWSGLSHAFCCVVEKNKNVIHHPRSVRIGKNSALWLEYPRPRAQFFPIRPSRLVNNLYVLTEGIILGRQVSYYLSHLMDIRESMRANIFLFKSPNCSYQLNPRIMCSY